MIRNLFNGNPDRISLGGFLSAIIKYKTYVLFFLIAGTSANAQTTLINPATDGGFESGSSFAANGWTAVNASTNTWNVGGVPAWQTGSNAAYISNNGGGAWAYNTGVVQASHFYKDIAFPAGETGITLTFDIRTNGNDGNWDNLQVYVMNTSITPTTAGPINQATTTTGWTGYTDGTTGYYLLRRNGSAVPTTTTAVSFTFTTAQATFCAGSTKRLVFTWKNDDAGGDQPPASIDNISLVSTCPGVTATAATTVGYNSFQANWNAFTGATAYNLEYRATGASSWTAYTGNPVTGTNAVINGLSNGITYQYRVSAVGPVCNAPSNVISATTSCAVPTAVTVSAVMQTTATIGWTAPTVAPGNGYEYEVRSSGAAGSGATGLVASGSTAAGVVTAPVTGLAAGTTYTLYVRSSCDPTTFGNWTSGTTFTTLCAAEIAPTAVQTFASATASLPAACWTEATGTLAATSNLTMTNSEWLASTGFANTGTNVGIKTNLYSAGNEWLISQPIDLGTAGNFRVKYDMAVTSYNGTAAQTTLGSHKVDLVISLDGGITWSNANIVKTYTGAATYSNTGTTEIVPLTGYTGVVRLAFVATTTSTSPDIDFHIDNFIVDEIPSCSEPTALTATVTSATTATIAWTAPATAPANGYEYEVRTSGAAGSGATGLVTSGTTAAGVVTKNITGLTYNTSYDVYVRSNCGSGSFSPWVGPANVFTGYCTPAPSSVDGTGITRVKVGTIDNATGAETGNYGDYTAMSTNIEMNSSVTVQITYQTGYTYDTKIWIDWNDDLDFNDAGENVYTGTSTSADPTTLNATFNVPVGTPVGSHRMRIGGQDAGPALVCYTGTYGAFEDYTVNVVCPATIPAPTAPVGDVVCVGATADLSVTGIANATLAWYDAASAGALVNSDDTYTTGALAATTSYWVEQSFPGCPTPSARIEVTGIVAPVNVALVPVNNTCNGYAAGSFTLGTVTCGTAPFMYSVDGGAFGAIPTNLAAGTHTVIVRDDAMGLSQPVSVVITEPAQVIATPTVANTTACEGATTKMVTATPAMVAAAPLVVSFDMATQPTETNAAPGNTIATATMPALPAGAVVTSVTLSMPGITALADSWQADVRLGLSGAITNTAAGSAGAPNSNGAFNYTRTVSNGSVDVAGGTVNLLYWDNWSDNTGAEATFPTGTGVATITINYNVPSNVTWWTASTGGTQLTSGTSLETVGTSVLASPAAPGTYTFYAQTDAPSGCSSVTRSALVVTVNENPEPVISSASLSFCAGDELELTAPAAASYLWSNSETTASIMVDAAGPYSVTVTDANGCVGTSPVVTVTENALPTVSAGADQTVCENAMVTLSGSGAVSYTWNNGVVNGDDFAATATTTYTVTGTDANGCENTDMVTVNVNALPEPTITSATGSFTICASDELELTSSSATGNVWSANNETTESITVDAAGSYTVTVTDANNCVGTSAPVTVVVNALPAVNAGSDIAVCKNGQAILFATGADSYAWSGNITNGVSFVATATTTYTVTGTDTNGCENTDQVVVTVNPLPTVEAGANQTLCGAGQVTLTATGAEVYSWNNGVMNGMPFTAPVGTNVYMVTGIDALGCANTDVVTVTVNAVPVATATAANQLTIVAAPAGMSYQWINCTTNQPILGANNQTFTASANGSYKVIVTGMGGCADTSACVNINSVGLGENTADLGISLYPNPTSGNVNVSMPSTEQANIVVYDAQGKVVTVMDNVQNGAVINLGNVEQGMYIIHVSNGNGSNIFRIVKN